MTIGWNDIKLKQYKEILKVDTKQDPIDYAAEMIKILFDIDDPLSLTLPEFNKYSDDIKIIGTEIPDVKLKDTYKVNGNEYILDGNVFEWKMSQLIDFRKYSQENDITNIAACYIIPKDHTYNDGYNMDAVVKDIECFPITDIIKMQNFFVSAFAMSIDISTDYLMSMMKKTPNAEIMKKLAMLKQLTMELKTDMTSSLTSLHIVE